MTVSEMPPRFKLTPSIAVDGAFWVDGEGHELIAWCRERVQSGANSSDLILPLKTRFGPLGIEALELAIGGLRAAGLPELEALPLVHRESLEQSSKPPLNTIHAQYFKGCQTVLEVGSGLGLDTIALARTVPHVISLEPNEQRARYVEANLAALGVKNVRIIPQRLEDSAALLTEVEGIFADPSRRKGGERVRDPNECSPPLDLLLQVAAGKRLVVKLSPTAGNVALPDCFCRHFIGSVDEALELVVCSERGADRMTIAERDGSVHSLDLRRAQIGILALEQARFLYDPHPLARSASGGIAAICNQWELSLATSEHGYLISAGLADPGVWAKRYEIVETISYREERIQELINRYSLSNDTAIKKREHKINPDVLHRALKWHQRSARGVQQIQHALVCIDSGTQQWCCLVRSSLSGVYGN